MSLTSFAVMLGVALSGALLEPPDGRVYHGTQTAFNSHIGYLEALGDSIQPAVRGTFISIPGTRPPANTFRGLRQFLLEADSVGFVPEVGLFMVTSSASPTGATDSIIAVSSTYDYFIDSLIVISRNYGRRMFVRIGGEFNGWWNGGGYHPVYYVRAFQKITDMYTAWGFRDSIATVWCYEPDAPDDFDAEGPDGPLWYPGDSYTDWFGLDVFDAEHFDQSLPDYRDGRITKKGKSERFLAMAREKGKAVYLNETSAKAVNITPDSLDSVHDWNGWFAKFWEFIDNHTEIKGFNYINQDWESTGYEGWGDARIQNSPHITAWYREEMHRPKYIHLAPPVSSVAPWDGTVAPWDGRQVWLGQSHPNPGTAVITIRFGVPERAWVDLRLFDALGREVATLVRGEVGPGPQSVRARTAGLSDGVYFYRMTSGGFTSTRKMVLVKGEVR